MQDATLGDTCFVCEEPAGDRGLLRLCRCKLAHVECKAGYRDLHRGSVHEVFCTDCNSLHATLPLHLASDVEKGRHVALVKLHMPDRKPVRCAVLSSTDGRAQLLTLAHAQTGCPRALEADRLLPGRASRAVRTDGRVVAVAVGRCTASPRRRRGTGWGITGWSWCAMSRRLRGRTYRPLQLFCGAIDMDTTSRNWIILAVAVGAAYFWCKSHPEHFTALVGAPYDGPDDDTTIIPAGASGLAASGLAASAAPLLGGSGFGGRSCAGRGCRLAEGRPADQPVRHQLRRLPRDGRDCQQCGLRRQEHDVGHPRLRSGRPQPLRISVRALVPHATSGAGQQGVLRV